MVDIAEKILMVFRHGMKGNMSIARMRIEINADHLMKMNFCVRLQTA